MKAGFGAVWLPTAIASKIPGAAKEWTWQWVNDAWKGWGRGLLK